MKEVKFRAWNKNMKRMFYTYEAGVTDGSTDLLEINMPQGFILMQYTGLEDKNDKGIYEGDILVAETPYDEDEGEDVLEVKYFKKEACFGVDLSSAEWHYDLSNDAKRFEVVGNIYEDSNLLKK